MVTGILGAGAQDGVIAVDLFLILAVAGLVALALQRMRMAVVPAYLVAGALIGPNMPWGFASQDSMAQVTQLAIVLLLFGIGLELDFAILRRGLKGMILAGAVSCLLSVVAGMPVAMQFGLNAPAALAVCMALSLSSTAVVLRIIAERRELRRSSGRLSFAILVIQDVLVLGMLGMLPILARWAGIGPAETPRGSWINYFTDTCLMTGGVAALVVASKAFLPAMLRESLRGRRLEVMMLIGLAAALGAAVVARAIGFSLEMGAFLAGFVLAGTPFRHQLSGQIGPLRDIFSALFFTTVGMKIDPAVVASGWWVILLAVLVVIVVKSVVIGGVCWSIGALPATSIVVGLSLAQGGEFSLVLLGVARESGILSETVTAIAIAVVVISLMLAPGVGELGRRLARLSSSLGHAPWVQSSVFGDESKEQQSPGARRHVIIGGFGPAGRRVGAELERAGVPFTIVELNPDTVVEQIRQRRSIVFGDISNLKVLESAGIGHADALILTIPDEDAVVRACAVARRRSPAIFIAARMGLSLHSGTAAKVGADQVVVDELATAEGMAIVIVERLGLHKPRQSDALSA